MRAAVLSCLAGACGALASVFAKIAFDSIILPSYLPNNFVFLARVIGVLMMLGTNVVMTALFASAMDLSSNTLSATALSSGTNFLLSGLAGFTLFGEILSMQWWIGSTVILCGVAIIASGSRKAKEQ